MKSIVICNQKRILLGKKNYSIRLGIFSCILRASQENSISRPKALYFKVHRERSGLSGSICGTNTTFA